MLSYHCRLATQTNEADSFSQGQSLAIALSTRVSSDFAEILIAALFAFRRRTANTYWEEIVPASSRRRVLREGGCP